MKKHDSMLINYIMKAERIDKNDASFAGIISEVQRQQSSSILFTVFMRNDVILCINNEELPPAFKVINAVDIKNSKKHVVFIDVTKLIELKNGYYVCKNISKLVSYIFSALIYLEYTTDTNKVISNGIINITGAECYSNMFTYVLDYLRIIGYSNNKDRIRYFAALFFLVNMLGKELNTYTKNLAAKVSGLNQGSINATDLYMEDGMFNDIDSFITVIANSFKLKGLTTEVFVQKWIYLFGNGTQYGLELYTSFATILAYTFCGSYIVNQKQIEKSCGTSMVKFCNALISIGVDMFDKRMYVGESDRPGNGSMIDKVSKSLQVPKYLTFVKEDFVTDDNSIEKKITDNIDYYTSLFNGEEKLDSIFETAVNMAIYSMELNTVDENSSYYGDSLKLLLTNGKKYFKPSTKRNINKTIKSKLESFNQGIIDYRNSDNPRAKRCAKASQYLRECIGIL